MPQPAVVRPPRRPPTRQTRTRGATIGAVVRAAASLLLLAALLLGLPVLLWWGTAIVGPPGIQALGNLLSTQDSGQVFLLALAVAGWAGWAGFAAAVAVEVPVQLRGRTAPKLRLLVGQRAAAALVGAILVALPTGTALASPTPAHAVTSAAAAASSPAPARGGHAAATPAATAQAEQDGAVTHTVRAVRPAESLWSIAEDRLGDGYRWEEIATLNDGRTMSDGTVFRAEDPIQPGWVLLLPDDAAPTGPRAQGGRGSALDETRPEPYTVRPGDTLSQIAEDELGDADRFPAIFRLNRGEAQPGGRHFTDPDLIYPGQHLDLPSSDTPTPAAGPQQDNREHSRDRTPPPGNTDVPSGPDRTARPSTAPQAAPSTAAATPLAVASPNGETSRPTSTPRSADPSRPADTTVPDRTPDHTRATQRTSAATEPTAATPTGSPRSGAPSAAEAPAASPSTPPSPSVSADAAPAGRADTAPASGMERQVVLTAGIGTLLAALLTGALGVRRILQQRRRRAGETIAIDDDPTRTEQVLQAAGEPAGVALLDSVLRTLAHRAAESGDQVPTVQGARVTASGAVHLVVDDPEADPVPPFTTGKSAGVWVLDSGLPLLPAEQGREVPAPYPGLVTLGAAESGDLVLVNLFQAGGLLLDGTPENVLAVARALALEAGTCVWSDHTEVLTVGLGSRLAGLLPKGRLRAMPHLSSVVSDLGALLVEVYQHGEDQAVEPLPWILICAADVDPEQVWQLADAIAAARNLPVTVVLPETPATRQAFPDASAVPVAGTTTASLPALAAGPVELQRLSDEQYRELVHALGVADQPAARAKGAWQLAEAHAHAAATARPAPHPMLLHPIADDASAAAEAGRPFPALLATADPGRIHLVKEPAPSGPDSAVEPENWDVSIAAESGETVSAAGEVASMPEPSGPEAPEINVLGSLQVSGITGSGHGPRLETLAALIYLKPGRNADALCTFMDPASPWTTRTLQSRLSEIRARFGAAPDGRPYLPRPRAGSGYAFHPSIRSDWARFQDLATRGPAAGPVAGMADLEAALALVRGRPFDGQEYPWAVSVQQEMLSRIVDVVHTLAAWHCAGDAPDWDAARGAVLRGLDIDETAEVLYRDWIAIEQAAGNHSGARKAVARVTEVTRAYDISMDARTEHAVAAVLEASGDPAAATGSA
ncbi:LysM domain-containing protein [Actinacidiphila glaucinigra]|uniref:LysM domain-containing protein n=1 Tax=Actinacidiphila glaucinigra TaxID=235986 RepID=A0A239LU76_9ACTN|nr:LysM domain-containing protein [Actinacidiphila glaucinigra]